LEQTNSKFKEKPLLTAPSAENPAYIFHHFIKSGGTSITNVLRKWFNVINDHFVSFDQLEEYKAKRVDINNIKSNDCIVGHYAVEGTYLFQRYPEILKRKDEIKVFTFLRDPLEFCLSLYFYSKKHGRMDQSMEKFFESNKDLLAYYMPCYFDYKEVLDRYFFIGITERMDESLKKLSSLVGRPLPEIQILNSTERDDQNEIVTDEFRRWFRYRNGIDYAMYQYALDRLDSIPYN